MENKNHTWIHIQTKNNHSDPSWIKCLERMCIRYCEHVDLTIDPVHQITNENGDLQSVTYFIQGDNSHMMLHHLHGVHTKVESPRNSNQKAETSAHIGIHHDYLWKIDLSNISTKKFSSECDKGGQIVGHWITGVQTTHMPSGITAISSLQRSGHLNREMSLRLLNVKTTVNCAWDGEHIWNNPCWIYTFDSKPQVKNIKTGWLTNNIQDVLNGRMLDTQSAHLRQQHHHGIFVT